MFKRFDRHGVPTPNQFVNLYVLLSQKNIHNKIKSGGLA